MEKKAIRYHRFSSDDQSQHSIERQEMITGSWLRSNNISMVDTFTDEGISARTFDRPDVKALFDFIKRNHRHIDYLVVSELTRFSRETGDAINMVKKIQSTYNIRIVSASRGQVYDIYDSGSFMMMGIEFLLGNTENIKRATDINGGIYTAKAIKGKWIQGGPAPFGYKKEGSGDQRRLVVHEPEAAVIRYIFVEYLKDVPVIDIKKQAKKMGLRRTSRSCIQEILSNPLYMSFQQVKPYRDQPGGLFPIKDLSPVIDPITWHQVQEKIAGPKYKKTISDTLPLRGVLRCYCNDRVSGAPSTNKIGKQYLYYKCARSRHLNLSATKAHGKLEQALSFMSLPADIVEAISEESGQQLQQQLKANKQQLQAAKNELEKIEKDIWAVEKKFIQEESITADTYHRWTQDLNNRRIKAGADVDRYSRDEQARWFLLRQELEKLTDLRYLYNEMNTTDKQSLLREVFDDRLYWQNSTYRTPYVMEIFTHNLLTLKEKQLLIVDGWDYSGVSSPVMWTPPASNRTLDSLLSFLSTVKVA